jgi:hypothetical protein
MSNYRFMRQVRKTPTELGYNAALSSAAVTGTAFDITGANAVTFFVHFTRAAGTGNMAFSVDVYDDIVAAWVPLHVASASGGTVTYVAASFVKATASASTTLEIRLRDLNFNKMRINSSIITSSSTDSLTISALVGEGPG